MKAKSLLYGFFIGGAAAGISTLLTSPISGRESRKYVKENMVNVKSQLGTLKNGLIDIKNATAAAATEGKRQIPAFSKGLQASMKDWVIGIQPHQETLQRQLSEIEEALHDLETELRTAK